MFKVFGRSAQKRRSRLFSPFLTSALGVLITTGSLATGDPTQPDNLPRSRSVSVVGPVLASVLISPGRKLAVINGHLLAEGESAAGVTLIEVSPGRAKVRLSNGKTHNLSLLAPAIGGSR